MHHFPFYPQSLPPSQLPVLGDDISRESSADQLTELSRYCGNGKLEIDNNLVENARRPTAVGKKNWLFIGHPDAGGLVL